LRFTANEKAIIHAATAAAADQVKKAYTLLKNSWADITKYAVFIPKGSTVKFADSTYKILANNNQFGRTYYLNLMDHVLLWLTGAYYVKGLSFKADRCPPPESGTAMYTKTNTILGAESVADKWTYVRCMLYFAPNLSESYRITVVRHEWGRRQGLFEENTKTFKDDYQWDHVIEYLIDPLKGWNAKP
jgi:hypothetical protein